MNYTEQAREALRIAAAQARELGHPYVGTEHLLLALRRVYTGVAGQILASNGVDEESILKVVDELVSPVGDVVIKERPGTVRGWNISWKKARRRRSVSTRKRRGRSTCSWRFCATWTAWPPGSF